jgi:glycosyltransferase involved in cell wall biosynthesis
VKAFYLKSDVFLFCSLRESFGSQMLEAMAFGLPVIALDHQGVRAFVPDAAGIKVPVTKPSETVQRLADAVTYLYRHPEKRLAARRYAYEYARRQVDSENMKEMNLSYDI